jgi:hypothetical protein
MTSPLLTIIAGNTGIVAQIEAGSESLSWVEFEWVLGEIGIQAEWFGCPAFKIRC